MIKRRPNILVIQADQLAANAIGAYQNPIASTPHMDSLAASGAIFDSAYSNFPLCAPSRFSMMAGQLPPAWHRKARLLDLTSMCSFLMYEEERPVAIQTARDVFVRTMDNW